MLIFLVLGLYPGTYTKTSPTTSPTQCTQINTSQADELKSLIKRLADQKDIHPNAIHHALKEKFNYASYRKIDCETWEKVKEVLRKE